MAKKKKRKKKLIKNKFRFSIFMAIVLALAFLGGYSIYKLGAQGNETPGVTSSPKASEASPAESASPSPQLSPSPSPAVTASDTSGVLTSAQAAKVVYDLVVQAGDGTKTMYDHTQKRDNVNYYVIRLYESSSDHITTVAWYYVRLDNGKVFLWDIIEDTLTPVN